MRNSPDTTIAIAGAGVMGLSLSSTLAQRQKSIALYDPAPTLSTSAMAGGMLAPYNEIEYMPEEFIPAARAGLEFWQRIPGSGFTRNGTLVIAHESDEYLFSRLTGRLENLTIHKTLNRSELLALEPHLENFDRALYIEEEAHLDTGAALQALMHHSPSPIPKNLDFKTAKSSWAVDCRGFYAAANDSELRGVRGEALIVRNPEFSLQRPVRLMHPRYPLYIVPRPNHIFMIGATMIESAEGGNTSIRSALELLSAAYSLHPSFGEAEILDIIAGIRPAYPDNLPRIAIDGNIIRCNGLFRHGFLLAPVMAECVADYLEGRDNEFTHLFMKEHHDHHAERQKNYRQRRA